MTDNLAIWNALSKTDPAHTKQFSRAGGFKGTALKPIWIIKRMTERFGPVGVGWGVCKPEFQVVQGDGETLVYCTVSAWHTSPDNLLWGVGGDKVVTKRQSGSFNDDEAFKKAFTDALNNALKSLGVGADIHMGQFEDDKYVASVGREFAEAAKPVPPPATDPINDATRDWISDKLMERQLAVGDLCAAFEIKSLKDLTYGQIDAVKAWLKSPTKKAA